MTACVRSLEDKVRRSVSREGGVLRSCAPQRHDGGGYASGCNFAIMLQSKRVRRWGHENSFQGG